jgi:hypothetical protein
VGQFQVYCRELHNEAIFVYLAQANPCQVTVLETLLKRGRKLDTQNPQRSSLGSDFGRLDRVVRDMDTVVATELAAGLQIPLPW